MRANSGEMSFAADIVVAVWTARQENKRTKGVVEIVPYDRPDVGLHMN